MSTQRAKNKVHGCMVSSVKSQEELRAIAITLLRAARISALGDEAGARRIIHWRARPLLDYVGGWKHFVASMTARNAPEYLSLFVETLREEE